MVLLLGTASPIDCIFFDINLNGAYRYFISEEFSRQKEADIRAIQSPFGAVDAYVRVVVKDPHDDTLAMVITPSFYNSNCKQTLTEIVNTLRRPSNSKCNNSFKYI